MTHRAFATIEAPSILGLFPKGVEKLPDALLGAGLAERLAAQHAGRVEPPAYDPERDPETLMLNPHKIAGYAVALADQVGPHYRRRLTGRARRRLFSPAWEPAGAQASRPLRVTLP